MLVLFNIYMKYMLASITVRFYHSLKLTFQISKEATRKLHEIRPHFYKYVYDKWLFIFI